MIKRLPVLLTLVALIIVVCAPYDSIAQEQNSDVSACAESLDYPNSSHAVDLRTLYRNGEYDLLLRHAKYMFKNGSGDKEVLGQMAEAAYNLAEIESGNKDVGQLGTIFIDDGGASDPIGYRLWHIKRKIGPNYWSFEVKDKFGPILRCSISIFLKSRPTFSGYLSRSLAITISTVGYDGAVEFMKKNTTIDAYDNPSNYYARFTERFIGVNDQVSAANFLIDVKNTYGMEKDVEEFWYSVILRSVEESSVLDELAKESLYSRIRNKIGK